MRLQQRPDQRQVIRVTDDDGVRVPHRDRRHLETRDTLAPVDLHLAEVGLDSPVAEHPRFHHPRPDREPHPLDAVPLGEPARHDARPVAGHLGLRAVRVPDRDVGRVRAGHIHLEDAVRVADELADAVGRELSVLQEQVGVAECVPPRGSHPRPRPPGDRRQR